MSVDIALAALATGQHGVVSRAQLVALGISARAVDRRVAAGRLHRLHRGVYAVGHRRVSRCGHWLAAVLACGDAAVLSHRDAAALWGLRPSSRTRFDVTVGASRSPAPARIDVHRAPLRAEDRAVREGIPVTSVARTLVDLAGVVSFAALERAVHESAVLRLLDMGAIEAAIGDGRGRRGVAALRRALAIPDAGIGRNDMEHLFVALCRSTALPSPQCNVHVWAGDVLYEIDAWFPQQRLAVELDGAATHLTRRAFESDRRKDAALLRAGVHVLRVTWRRLTIERRELVSDLRALLDQP